VKVFWLDRATIVERLRQAAERLLEAHPEVEEVALFGSLARGDAVPGSDADVLVVLKETHQPFFERMPLYSLGGVGIGVDVFPYTRDELLEIGRTRPRFHRALTEESLVLCHR
jgi:predicted nucleotidyltransferase